MAANDALDRLITWRWSVRTAPSWGVSGARGGGGGPPLSWEVVFQALASSRTAAKRIGTGMLTWVWMWVTFWSLGSHGTQRLTPSPAQVRSQVKPRREAHSSGAQSYTALPAHAPRPSSLNRRGTRCLLPAAVRAARRRPCRRPARNSDQRCSCDHV